MFAYLRTYSIYIHYIHIWFRIHVRIVIAASIYQHSEELDDKRNGQQRDGWNNANLYGTITYEYIV